MTKVFDQAKNFELICNLRTIFLLKANHQHGQQIELPTQVFSSVKNFENVINHLFFWNFTRFEKVQSFHYMRQCKILLIQKNRKSA